MQIEDRIRIGKLFSEYGNLLTEKQRTVLTEYCELDLSLFEISEQYGVTRQAIRDTIIRASERLIEYEKLLGNLAFKAELKSKIERLESSLGNGNKLNEIKEMLEG